MRVLHVSDTHGYPSAFDAPGDVKVIVHSGDLLPNHVFPSTPSARRSEERWQAQWTRDNTERLARLIGNRKFLFMPGNHDFGDACSLLRNRHGVDAWNLHVDGPKIVNGLVFGGIPFIPWMGGIWNHERPEEEIGVRFSDLLEEYAPDVIVNHCPPYGVLDDAAIGYGGRANLIGSIAVRERLLKFAYLPSGKYRPRWYLTGHCHECGGFEIEFAGIRVSNAATTTRVIDLDKKEVASAECSV